MKIQDETTILFERTDLEAIFAQFSDRIREKIQEIQNSTKLPKAIVIPLQGCRIFGIKVSII